MVSKFTLLTSLLLASGAFAATSRLEARLARRRENRQSRPINRVEARTDNDSDVEYSENWAGAVLIAKDECTFTSVTGTFTVPNPSGAINSSASAWVGIDGDTCDTAILQTGVDFTVTDDGPSYDAWYEWYPDYAYDFSGITINTGDKIKATVTASSLFCGVAVIENLTNGQKVTEKLTSPFPLCEENAEWIVEDFEEDDSLVPFANFGNVTFTSALASGPGGTYTPSTATIVDIKQNNKILTSVSTSGSNVIIEYQ